MSLRQEYVSVSRLKLYERCPRAFNLQYFDKGPVEPRGAAGMHGNVLHRSLEIVYRWIVDEEYAGIFPLDRLILAYRQAWNEESLSDVTLYQEGLAILRAYADRTGLVDHMKVIGVEQEFRIKVGPYTLLGYIDHVEKLGDDGVQILDFKSNRSLFSRHELDSDIQASAYLIAQRTLWPWARQVRFAFDMLRHGVRQGVERTSQDLADAEHYIVTLAEKTETDTEWAPKLNTLCSYCDHRKRCPAYAEALAGGHSFTKVRSLDTLDAIALERERVAKLAKMAYARQRELDDILKAKLAEEGEFDAGGSHFRLVNSFETEYPSTEKVWQAFRDAGLDADTINDHLFRMTPSSVKSLLARAKELLDRSRASVLEFTLNAVAVKVPQSPKIEARANKLTKSEQKIRDEAKEARA